MDSLDLKLNSSQLIDFLKESGVSYPKAGFWDAIWTMIYMENENIKLLPKKELGEFSEDDKKHIFLSHIKEAEKCGKLQDVISFINKTKLQCF